MWIRANPHAKPSWHGSPCSEKQGLAAGAGHQAGFRQYNHTSHSVTSVPFLKGRPPGKALGRHGAGVGRRVLVPEEVDAVVALLLDEVARARIGRLALHHVTSQAVTEGAPLLHGLPRLHFGRPRTIKLSTTKLSRYDAIMPTQHPPPNPCMQLFAK